MEEKKVIGAEVEAKFINLILRFATDEGLTIVNIKEAINKTCSYLEENATLKKDYREFR